MSDGYTDRQYTDLEVHPQSLFSLFTSIWCLLQIRTAATAKSLQSCPTLCDPIDGSPPGSPVPGILQARTLEWAAISFSSAWKWKVYLSSIPGSWDIRISIWFSWQNSQIRDFWHPWSVTVTFLIPLPTDLFTWGYFSEIWPCSGMANIFHSKCQLWYIVSSWLEHCKEIWGISRLSKTNAIID